MFEEHMTPPPPVESDAALFVDFDGTLVEIAETPDAIRMPRALPNLLDRIAARLGGRLAIVSGRSIADLERHLGRSGLAMSGSHGLELRLPGGAEVPIVAPRGLEAARREIGDFAAAEGLIVEHKPASIALHFRQAPALERRVAAFLAGMADAHGLFVQHGKMVAELRPRGADKGDAVRRLMAEPLFASARPFFVGDDLTDEDGFRAAADLGGGGILVGAPRPSAARWRLPNVEKVIAWLEAAANGAGDG
jgi:trehalose 6-phosphate phosphatase